MQVGGRLGPEEFWARVREMDARILAAGLTLPAYRISGWSGAVLLGEFGLGGTPGQPVGVLHTTPGYRPGRLGAPGTGGRIDVVTHGSIDDVRPVTGPGELPPRAAGEVRVVVDGTAHVAPRFALGRRWGAGVAVDGHAVEVRGEGVDAPAAIALEPVADLAALLAARDRELRAWRGEDPAPEEAPRH